MTLDIRKNCGNHTVIAVTNSSTNYVHIFKPVDDLGYCRSVSKDRANEVIAENHLGEPFA